MHICLNGSNAQNSMNAFFLEVLCRAMPKVNDIFQRIPSLDLGGPILYPFTHNLGLNMPTTGRTLDSGYE